jgi:hypothetical protein
MDKNDRLSFGKTGRFAFSLASSIHHSAVQMGLSIQYFKIGVLKDLATRNGDKVLAANYPDIGPRK